MPTWVASEGCGLRIKLLEQWFEMLKVLFFFDGTIKAKKYQIYDVYLGSNVKLYGSARPSVTKTNAWGKNLHKYNLQKWYWNNINNLPFIVLMKVLVVTWRATHMISQKFKGKKLLLSSIFLVQGSYNN